MSTVRRYTSEYEVSLPDEGTSEYQQLLVQWWAENESDNEEELTVGEQKYLLVEWLVFKYLNGEHSDKVRLLGSEIKNAPLPYVMDW